MKKGIYVILLLGLLITGTIVISRYLRKPKKSNDDVLMTTQELRYKNSGNSKLQFAMYPSEESPLSGYVKDSFTQAGAKPVDLWRSSVPAITNEDIEYTDVIAGNEKGNFKLKLELNPKGKAELLKLSNAQLNKHLAIAINGTVKLYPIIKEPLSEGVIIFDRLEGDSLNFAAAADAAKKLMGAQ